MSNGIIWAVSLDGEDDYIDLGKLGNLGRNIGTAKISVTFKTPKNYAPGYFTSLYETLNDGSNGFNIIVRLNAERYLPNPVTYAPGKTFFYIRTGPDQIIGCHINEPALYDGEYHKLTVDYTDVRNSNLKIFIDEKPVQIQHYSHKTNITSSAENIQYSLNFGANNSRGTIGLFSAITIANIEITISDQPHAEYPMNEGQGNIIHDVSGNDYHGEIVGGVWVPTVGDLVTGSITFRGRSLMSLAGVKRATGSITFRGQSSMFLSAVKTAVGKITFRGGSFMSLIGLVLRELEGVYQISSSEIVSRNQPVLSTDLANYIEVWINPRVPADQAEEVYRSKEPEPIPPGESKAFNLKLDKEPVIEAVASLEDAGANLAITDTKFYSGSAEITVTNTGTTEQTCIIVIQARPLELQGRRKIVVKDEESILDHGLVKYTFDSPLVQDEASARDIGKKILWLFSVARANIEIEWRGDPALELADPVQIPEFEKLGVSKKENFYVVRQLLEVVEGGLDATLSGRKIPKEGN